MLTQERLTVSYWRRRSGMALYLVLAVLIVTFIVAGMSLNLVLSQSRLTHHSVSRVQAYYAAKLGMNYAIEMLSNNDTTWSSAGTYTICRSGCTHNETDLPGSINDISVIVGALGSGLEGTRNLTVTVNYTYQQ